MKYRIIGKIALATLLTISFQPLSAQQKSSLPKKATGVEKKERSEKMTIIIDGDNVTINGKPVTEYDGDNIVIRKKNLERAIAPFAYSSPRVRVAPHGYPAPHAFNFEFPEPNISVSVRPRTQLGVLTEAHDKGAKITEVVKESAASKAGLVEGDIITAVDGDKVEDPDDLAEIIQDKKPGEETEIAYLRGKKTQKVKVKLGESKEATALTSSGRNRNQIYLSEDMDMSPRSFNRVEGFGLQKGEMFFSRAPRLGLKIEDTEENKGARVLYVEEGSAAEKAGIKKDDIISSIDTSAVKDTDDARRALSLLGGKQNFSINVQRSGSPIKIDVKIPKELRKTDL